MAELDYRPGEKVPRSGIYVVMHAGHRAAHESVVLAGSDFPGCRHCGEQVRYRLLRSASPIEADHDFEAGRGAKGSA